MKITNFPRVRITHGPTPLEFMPRMSEALGGPNLYIKRDDCTGLGSGGNKTRKLEFLMADAVKHGADTIITQGATQSNHNVSQSPVVHVNNALPNYGSCI